MRWLILTLSLLLPVSASASTGGMWPVPMQTAVAASYIKTWLDPDGVYPDDTPTGGNTYCVREDGTAVFASATDCSNASTSMSPATFNASSFSDADIVYISSRGGDIDTALSITSGGSTPANRITYQGEDGYTPTVTASGGIWVKASNIDLIDLISDIPGESAVTFGEDSTTYTGIRSYNIDAATTGNQTFQHLGTVSVDHYNVHLADAADECLSSHNDATINIYGGLFENCTNGMNWVSTPDIAVYDVKITGVTGYAVQISASGGSLLMDGCWVEEDTDNANYMIDNSAMSSMIFRNSIFFNLTDYNYYLLLRTQLTTAEVTNCAFIGDGVATTTAVFNQAAASIVKNNIFYNTGVGGLYGTTGADSNIFYLSGTAKGTNTFTTDPGWTDAANGDFSFADTSDAYQNGADLSGTFTEDYLNNDRTGVTSWDIGPVQVSQ